MPIPPTFFKDIDEKMKRAEHTVARELAEVRGGRASPAMVEPITVEYYGASTPLKQLAAITAPDPRLLVIQPWDGALVPEIERAILKAGLGMTPVVDGKLVRLPIPPLTGERREELKRVAHRVAEEGRVAIRAVRRDANEAVKKLKTDKQASEDEAFKAQEQIQKATDRYIEHLNQALAAKEQELSAG